MAQVQVTERIRPLKGREAGLLVRLLAFVSRLLYRKEMGPVRVVGYNQRFLLPYTGMLTFVSGKSHLDPGIRTLACQLVSERNGCAWCIDFGLAEGQKQGITLEKLLAVGSYDDSPLFSDAERAALAFAEATNQVGIPVSDELFAELRRHFSEREIVELTVAVAAEGFFNRVNAALGVETQGFCGLPAFAGAGHTPDA